MTLKDYLTQPIAFDADGVLLDFLHAFVAAASQVTGRSIVSLDNSYNLSKRYHLTESELNDTWNLFNSQGYWQSIQPLQGAMESIDLLKTKGFTNFHVVTAIPDAFKDDRHLNFKNLGFHPNGIHCVEHTTRWSKVPPIQALKPVIFVDDRIEHLHANPQVNLLIHIDHGDEQFPDPAGGRVDATVPSLISWTRQFLADPDYWIHQANSNQHLYTTTSRKISL